MYKRTQIEIGQKFGRWTILSKSLKIVRYQAYWLCRCDCGAEKCIGQYSFYYNQSKSCGCLKKSHHQDLPDGEAAMRSLYRQYIHGAKQRELEFSLSLDEFRSLVTQNCFYCNSHPRDVTYIRSKLNGKNRSPAIGKHNGVDRIDSTKGYCLINVRPCCPTCNYAKLQMSDMEFSTWIKRVFQNLQSWGVQ